MTDAPMPARYPRRQRLVAAAALPLLVAANAQAEVQSTGYVSPNPLFVTAQDDLLVGSSFSIPGTLDITNGSVLASREGRLRGNGTYVRVHGVGSAWLMFGDLNLSGTGVPHLLIEAGGWVRNIDGEVYGATGSPGYVAVDGAGSVWDITGDLYVGGAPNVTSDGYVTITGGGVVNVAGGAFIGSSPNRTGYIAFDDGTLNTTWGLARIDDLRGAGTINADHWLLTGDYTLASAADLPSVVVLDERPGQNMTLNLGWSTPLDQLEVFGIDDGTLDLTNGLAVTSGLAHIGYSGGTTQGIVNVIGTGTVWSINNRLDLGGLGDGTLNIIGGGHVAHAGLDPIVGRAITIGVADGSTGTLLIEGPGSRLDAETSLELGGFGLGLNPGPGRGDMSVRAGGAAVAEGINLNHGLLHISGAGSTLELSGRLLVREAVAGTPAFESFALFENGASVSIDLLTLEGAGSLSELVLATGTGTSVTLTDRLVVGNNGDSAALRVADGAVLTTVSASIGLNTNSAPSSAITVTGTGSRLTVEEDLYIGHGGTGSLLISDGGRVEVGGLLILNQSVNTAFGITPITLDQGTLVLGTSNALYAEDVMGVGTVHANTWLLEGDHTITGFDDLPAQILVSQFEGQALTVNLSWIRNAGIDFQQFGVNDGSVTITDGMALRSSSGVVGYYAGSDASVTLTEPGTVWRVGGFTVGASGTGVLRIEDGTLLTAESSFMIGQSAGSSGTVVVSGPDAALSPTTDHRPVTTVGSFGTGLLRIENGAVFGPGSTFLGRNDGAVGELVVTGSGTTLTSTSTLFLGQDGTDGIGLLRVLDGAQVLYQSINVNGAGDLGSRVEIDGAGSSVQLQFGLHSEAISSDWLSITNGGTLVSHGLNRLYGGLLIDGSGSAWSVEGDLYLGDRYASSLDLTGGAVLTTHNAFIGQNRYSTSDARADVLVDGPDTLWSIEGNLTIGGTTGDNFAQPDIYRGTLTIANGGTVTATGAVLVDPGPSGSSIAFDNGTLNVDSALVYSTQLTGAGTVNADYWLISGDHVISDFSTLPTQIVYDQLPGQAVTVNLAWSDPTRVFEFFGVDDGTVLAHNGFSVHSTTGYLAFNPGSVADFSISGEATGWIVDEELRVGFGGDGALSVLDGAQLTANHLHVADQPGSVGHLRVAGAGSSAVVERLHVGQAGVGNLSITHGGEVAVASMNGSSNGQLVFAEVTSATATATISGAGSRLDAALVRSEIGVHGAAHVTVEDGAIFASGYNTYLGLAYDGLGQLVVDDAVWLADFVLIGFDGTGTVELRNGAFATAGTVRLGSENDTVVDGVRYASSGHAVVQGAGTTWDLMFDMNVGRLGNGTLSIIEGGVVNSRRGYITSNSTTPSHVTVSGPGSAWHMTEDLSVGPGSTSSLVVEAGGRVVNRDTLLYGTAVVDGADSLLRSEDLAMQSGGVLQLANGGQVELAGNLIHRSSAGIRFTFGDAGPGHITVAGDLNLNSAGSVSFAGVDGAGLSLSDQLTLIQVGGQRLGAFNNAFEHQTVATHNGLDLLLTYTAGGGNDVGLITAVTGDLDGDHLADAADLRVILEHWEQSVTPADRAAGDLNADGLVNGEDLLRTPQAILALGAQLSIAEVPEQAPGPYAGIVEGQTLVRYDGVDLLLTYLAGDGDDIALTTAVTGDADGDGVAGVTDLDLLLANWGDTVTPSERAAGDLDGDGLVGQGDLDLVMAYWGNNGLAGPQVPEPSGVFGLLPLMYLTRRIRATTTS